MDSIIQAIVDWLKELLVSGIMGYLTNTFDSVNTQVGQIATEVGMTPSAFSLAIFNMIKNLSENVIMPVAGLLLTFIACYELIQLVISHNNLANFETWIFFKWVFKTFVAVTLITNTMNITMAVFDVAHHVLSQAGGIISGSTAIDASTLATMQSTLEATDLASLLTINNKEKAAEKRLAEIAVLKTHIINYSKTKDVYVDYRKSGYSKHFFEAHREEILLHKAAKETFGQLDGSIPKIKELNQEYAELLQKKKEAYSEYRVIKEENRELQMSKHNLERFLNQQEEEQKEKYKQHKRNE